MTPHNYGLVSRISSAPLYPSNVLAFIAIYETQVDPLSLNSVTLH